MGLPVIIRVVPLPARRPVEPPPSLDERAAADLRFIRGAMERSASFTAVPGLGGMAMGAVALAAAAVARAIEPADGEARLAVWVGTAIVAAAIGVVTMQRKAAREGLSLTQGPDGASCSASVRPSSPGRSSPRRSRAPGSTICSRRRGSSSTARASSQRACSRITSSR